MMFCWHVWKITDRTEHPSCMDALKDRRVKADDMGEFNRRPVIVASRCEKCGTEKVERI